MLIDLNFDITEKNYFLCYMDTNNKLSELNSQELIVRPFELKSRRFYLVSSTLNNKVINVEANVLGFNSFGFNCLISCNNTKSFESNFETFIIDINNKPLFGNAVPIDILLTSKNSNEINSKLNIKIEILDIGS